MVERVPASAIDAMADPSMALLLADLEVHINADSVSSLEVLKFTVDKHK